MQSPTSFTRGLINCQFKSDMSSGILTYCCLKTIEMSISGIFVIICLYQLHKQVQTYGWKFQWRFFSITWMILALLTNMSFCLWNEVFALYSIQSFFYSLYFLTIVGYVFRLYMRKNAWDTNPTFTHIFTATLIIMGLLYTSILVDSLVTDSDDQKMVNQSCEEVWYLCINVMCLFLCFVALLILYFNQKQEYEKISSLSFSQSQVRNPLRELWVWIGINTIAQIVDLIETGLLIGTNRQQNCRVIKDNEVGNYIFLFFFDVIALTAGFAATLYYFAQVRKATGYVNHVEFSKSVDFSQERASYGVQMFQAFIENFEN